MRKFLGVSLAVGALVIFAGAAVAQMEHGSGHDMHGAMGQAGKAGHHEMMKSQMSKAGHEMNCPMGQAGHEMKSHMGKGGHDMKGHTGKAGHE
jgi:hypothetical protein